jgi:HD superfamily phosphohydrolase YqeK
LNEDIAHIRTDGIVQTLADHLNGVAERAGGFASRTSWRNWAYTAGLLHDAGKRPVLVGSLQSLSWEDIRDWLEGIQRLKAVLE